MWQLYQFPLCPFSRKLRLLMGEKNIAYKGRKKYKMEVSKRAQEYVLRLIDIKADKEIEVLRMRSNQALMDLQAQLLTDLTKSIERYTMQAALDSPAAHTVVFSARTWVTQPLHLVRNDTTLVFAPGALVLAKAGAFQEAYHCLFACYLARNLTIRGYGATWRMRRSDYNDSAKYTPSVSLPRSWLLARAPADS